MFLFGDKLKKWIEFQGIDITTFANKMGVSRGIIYNINLGQRPSLNFIMKLIENYPEIDLNWLLKDSNTNLDPRQVIEPEGPDDYLKLIRNNLDRLESITKKKNQ